MSNDLEKVIQFFIDNLEQTNELHHPNDYRRLYNIALVAVSNNEQIPYDEFKSMLYNAVKERSLNKELFEATCPKYIDTLVIAYDIINRMKEKHVVIPNSLRI